MTFVLKSLYSEEKKCQELIGKILEACPDQLNWYLMSFKNTITPRDSEKWYTLIDLLLKVFCLITFYNSY